MSLLEGTAWDPKYRVVKGAIVLIFAGCMLLLWGGWGDFRLTVFSSSEPQTITAAELASNGPGNNLHVLVTEYGTSEAIGNDDVAFAIVRPRTRDDDQASLLLKTQGGSSFFGVAIPNDGLQGLVRKGSGTFNVDQRYAIKKLGKFDFDNCWIIDHNRQPPPWWSFLLKIIGGIALIAVGVALLISSGSDD